LKDYSEAFEMLEGNIDERTRREPGGGGVIFLVKATRTKQSEKNAAGRAKISALTSPRPN